MYQKNDVVIGFPDVSMVPAPPNTLLRVPIPMPYLNDNITSKKLTNDVIKNRKIIKKVVEKEREKYYTCPYCAEPVSSKATVCKTCKRYTKVNSSTEYKCIDDHYTNELCEAFAMDIIKMVYPYPGNKLSVDTLTKEYIETYNTLKFQFDKQVEKYIKCPNCSELVSSKSTICSYCDKEV